MIQVLNAALYVRLEREYGEVQILNHGVPASFTMPIGKSLGFRFGVSRSAKGSKKTLLFPGMTLVGAEVQNSEWGEIYQVCCPCCGDSRFRLNFCHLYGTQVREKPDGNRWLVFGTPAVCFNEQCQSQRREDFRHLVDAKLFPDGLPITAETFTDLAGMVVEGVVSPFRGQLATLNARVRAPWRLSPMASSVMPKKCRALNDPGVPAVEKEYLRRRGFDPERLYQDYQCMWVPRGSEYQVVRGSAEEGQPEWRKMDVNRLLIPIVQGGLLVSWQARVLYDQEKGDPYPKYRNPTGIPKTCMVYNQDRAKFFDFVVITEGITNVWAMGENQGWAGVCVFGKTVSEVQMLRMRDIWGFGGMAVLNLDPDAAERELPKYLSYLRRSRAFKYGVAPLVLEPGQDAAKMYADGRGAEYESLVRQAFEQCTNEEAQDSVLW